MNPACSRADGPAAAVVVLAVIAAAGGLQAGVVSERLRDVVVAAPVIVLAEVTAVEGLPRGDWKATARVIEVWKGPQRKVISYGPAGHGDVPGCEASAAKVGETVVLLLEPEPNRISDLLRIVFVGYGRLPVYTIDGKQFVEASGYSLPDGARTTQAPIGDHTRDLLSLDWLREFVRAACVETPSDGG